VSKAFPASLTLRIACAALIAVPSLLGGDTRGITVTARDPATLQAGEVRLYDRTFAVVIAIDHYLNLPADRQLAFAVKDGKAVEQALAKGFHFDRIITLYDDEATKERIMRLLTAELPREMGKEDALFIFWAGHGNQEKSDYGDLGYLIPYDGSADAIYKNITMAEIRDTISKKLPAKHVFYVFDACYSGLLTTRGVDAATRRDLGYLKEITREPVRQVLTAGGKGEEALDGGPRGHSVFTGRFLEALENATDFITANELQVLIRERVSSDARGRGHAQTPAFGPLYGMGDFVFIPKAQDRLADLAGVSASRQKELDLLRKTEADMAEAKAREQAEVARKQAELDALDRQIADMKGRLTGGGARSTDSLDQIMALAAEKETQGKHLEELKRQRDIEEAKRQTELQRLKDEAVQQRKTKIQGDLAKYETVAASKYAQDLKGAAWAALVGSYPEAKSLAVGDVKGFRALFGLARTAAAGQGIFLGTKVRILYLAKREANARTIGEKLKGLGVEVEYMGMKDSSYPGHEGKVYFYEGFEDLAKAVAQEVGDLEVVAPSPMPSNLKKPDAGQNLNLWVVRK